MVSINGSHAPEDDDENGEANNQETSRKMIGPTNKKDALPQFSDHPHNNPQKSMRHPETLLHAVAQTGAPQNLRLGFMVYRV